MDSWMFILTVFEDMKMHVSLSMAMLNGFDGSIQFETIEVLSFYILLLREEQALKSLNLGCKKMSRGKAW